MIRSMTGYGRGQASVNGVSLTVEIKAVNHRYGDISIKAPRLLAPYEAEVKKQVAEVLKRGKIDLYVAQEHTSELLTRPTVDEALARAYLDAFRRLQQITDLPGTISLEFLAAQKDVLILEDIAAASEDLRGCLEVAVSEALAAIVEMRRAEGEATAEDIGRRLVLLDTLLESIAEMAPRVPEEWQQKLRERLDRLQNNGADPQRVAQEIAIFADRCDISEELSRFRSHLEQFSELLKSAEPVGRQMDFLTQELNREANTMSSKSNDAALTRQVVALKAELEKIREQVQNIE